MRNSLLLAGMMFLLGSSSVFGQVTVRTQTIGKQKISTIEQIPEEKGDKKNDMAPEGVTLTARDWKCGRYFTDNKGRFWSLNGGTPMSHKPLTVQGTTLRTPDGRLFLLTTGGNLFLRIESVPGVEVVK